MIMHWLLNHNSWLISIQWLLILIVVLRNFPSSSFWNDSFSVKSSDCGFNFVWISHDLVSQEMESIDSLLKLFVKMLWLSNVSILFNLWLIFLYLFSVISIFLINLIEFIKFNFKSTLDFFLINISISESLLQIRACIYWLIIGLVDVNSIQSIRWLNLSWNHEVILMSWVHCFSAWLSWIGLEIIESLLLRRVRIVNMSSFISSDLLNVWLMLSKLIFVLIDWISAINDLVSTIIDNLRIVNVRPSMRLHVSANSSSRMGAVASMCTLSHSLLNKMPLWLLWLCLLPLKVID